MSFYEHTKAFPINIEWDYGGEQGFKSAGMNLRDYFAIKIVQAMITNNKIYKNHPDEHSIIRDAFLISDYMMEARK